MPAIERQYHVDDRQSSKESDQASRDSKLGSLEANGFASSNFEKFSHRAMETTETQDLHVLQELDLQNLFNEFQALKEHKDISNIPSEISNTVFNINNFKTANSENDHNTTEKEAHFPTVVHCAEQVTNDLFGKNQESQEHKNIVECFLNDDNLTAVNSENNPYTIMECTETPKDHKDYVLRDLFDKSIIPKDCENITGSQSEPIDLLDTSNFNTANSENCPNAIAESAVTFEHVLEDVCAIIEEFKECENTTCCPSEINNFLVTYIFNSETQPKTIQRPAAQTHVHGAEHDVLNQLCAVSQESKECEDTPSELLDVLNFNNFETVNSKNSPNTIMKQADTQSVVHGAECSSNNLIDISQESMVCENISGTPSGFLDFVNISNLKSVNSPTNSNPVTECIETLDRLDENKVHKGRKNIPNTPRSEPSEPFDLNDYIFIKPKNNHNSTEGCAEIKNHKKVLALENEDSVNGCTSFEKNVNIINVSCTKKLLTTIPRENDWANQQQKKLPVVWTVEATKMLIDRINQNKYDFDTANSHQKSMLWKEVSKTLQAHNHNYCASKCSEKWRGLKKRYMNIKNGSGKSGWPLFELVQDALAPSEKKKIISLQKDSQSQQKNLKPRTVPEPIQSAKNQITNHLNPGMQEPKTFTLDDLKKIVPSKRKAIKLDETAAKMPKPEKTLFKCSLCHKGFEFKRGPYKSEDQNKCWYCLPPKGMRAYQCTRCSEEFFVKTLLDRHVRMLHTPRKQFQCVWCEIKFNNRYLMQEHQNRFHLKLTKEGVAPAPDIAPASRAHRIADRPSHTSTA